MPYPTTDVDDLWAIYQSTKSQVIALQAALAAIAAGGDPDVSAWAESGGAGSESISQESLTARLERMSALMGKQRDTAIKATGGIGIHRLGRM